ncbi:MAG: FAD-binding oxidoreductase [Candidatus Paceibacterota bacterium]
MDIKRITKETGVTVKYDAATRKTFSRDTSLFAVEPTAVVFPRTSTEVERLVSFVTRHKAEYPELSLTARSAGTDMTGGPLNESLIMSCTEYLNAVPEVGEDFAVVQPGVFYRDFEERITPGHLTMPTYPASKSIAALGGMIMNNCGGEKTLRYGQMREFVNSVKMVLSDANEYTFGPLSRAELEEKKTQADFEGEVYRRMHQLLEDKYELVKQAKPATSKNSAGYALWEIWDRESEIFDLSQLFVGSQGTLGMLTEANVRLIKKKENTRMIPVFMPDWDHLPELVNRILPFAPESLEVFDEDTELLGLRFLPEIAKKAGKSLLAFAFQFLPEAWIGIKMHEIPDLVVLIELAEDEEEKLQEKAVQIAEVIDDLPGVYHREPLDDAQAEKYWIMRRESFNLLRNAVGDKQTAPFVEDFCISPDDVPNFLPRARELLESHGIDVNIAGHAGNGNFHIIPLMDLTKKEERMKIPVVAQEFYDLVLEYNGTITAEHNDGIIRTPFLEQMYGSEVYNLFKEVKQIFDPQNIFNPGKKIGGTLEYVSKHISAKDK